eukprot:GEMP01039163.1.p1 GENE.GEMP01039163.1~~GEMP01039163.1.p1  ORF type:complete len:481 (+),score=63.40 GEMP01039163.1:435-1877(+)
MEWERIVGRDADIPHILQWKRILVQYVRMSGTVVIAVVVRLTMDAFGIVFAGLNAEQEKLVFAYCPRSSCLIMGITELILAVICASAFVWSWHEHLADSKLSRCVSLGLIIGAAEWVPISLLVTKTNMVMGYVIDGVRITPNGFIEAIVFALVLNSVAAAFTHYHLKERQEYTLNPRGFWKFTLLLILYALSWGVGWAYWDAALRLLKSLEASPISIHISHVVLVGVILVAMCLYLQYGPEPVVPQRGPESSASFSRSWTSFAVYSSVVLLVMCLSDPDYGLLHLSCQRLYPAYVFPHETAVGFLLFCAIALGWTLISVSISSQLTRRYGVDMLSSIRLSRQKLAYAAKVDCLVPCSENTSNDLTNVTVSCCLLYDVMALSTAFAWGQVATGGLSLFRPLIEYGAASYLLIAVSYCICLVLLIAGAVMHFCPTEEELQRRSLSRVHSPVFGVLSPRAEIIAPPYDVFRLESKGLQNDRAA